MKYTKDLLSLDEYVGWLERLTSKNDVSIDGIGLKQYIEKYAHNYHLEQINKSKIK